MAWEEVHEAAVAQPFLSARAAEAHLGAQEEGREVEAGFRARDSISKGTMSSKEQESFGEFHASKCGKEIHYQRHAKTVKSDASGFFVREASC